MQSEFSNSARGRFFEVRWDGKVRTVTEDEFNRRVGSADSDINHFHAFKPKDAKMSESGADRKLPRYKCHKEVYALKITGLQPVVGGAVIITTSEPGYMPFRIEHPYAEKHKPEVGGYWVEYDDGYQSYSPAKAFEEGYTRI